MEIISLSCPNCGAPVSTRQNNCEYCQSPVIITSFTNIADMPLPQISKYADSYKKTLAENPDSQDLNLSIGICYLRLKMYEKASASFEKAMEDNLEEYLNAAVMIEPRAVFYYFMSYIKQDYYNRKFFKTSPTSEELYATAIQYGLTETDIQSFHSMIGMPRP